MPLFDYTVRDYARPHRDSWSSILDNRSVRGGKRIIGPSAEEDDEDQGVTPSRGTQEKMRTFFDDQGSELWDGAAILRDVVDGWRGDNGASGLPVHAHRPLPSRFGKTLSGQIGRLPEPDRDIALTELLAKSAPGVKRQVSQQLGRLMLYDGAQLRSSAEQSAHRGQVVELNDNPLNANQLEGTVNQGSALLGNEREWEDNRFGARGTRDSGARFATLEFDPQRDRPRVRPMYDVDVYQSVLRHLSPEEKAEFYRGLDRDVRATVGFLGDALYALSPLPQAREFVEAVRNGEYAYAAIALMMAGLPALKGVRVTHHIIARLASQHRDLQRMLDKFGIDIDEPANLSRVVEDVHRVLHTHSYYRYVARRLEKIRGPDDIRTVLKDIKKVLERLENRDRSRGLFPPKRRPRNQ